MLYGGISGAGRRRGVRVPALRGGGHGSTRLRNRQEHATAARRWRKGCLRSDGQGRISPLRGKRNDGGGSGGAARVFVRCVCSGQERVGDAAGHGRVGAVCSARWAGPMTALVPESHAPMFPGAAPPVASALVPLQRGSTAPARTRRPGVMVPGRAGTGRLALPTAARRATRRAPGPRTGATPPASSPAPGPGRGAPMGPPAGAPPAPAAAIEQETAR